MKQQKTSDFELVNYLFKRDNFEISTDKDLFRSSSTNIIQPEVVSKIDINEYFQQTSQILQSFGLTEEQCLTLFNHPFFNPLFIQALTHWSFHSRDEFHLSNEYLERQGSFIIKYHLLCYLRQYHPLKDGISGQDRYSLILQWFLNYRKAAHWLDEFGLTKFIKWSPIILETKHTTRSIILNDKIKWNVFLAWIAVIEQSINFVIAPGTGTKIVQSLLEPFWHRLQINMNNMNLYKDIKSQLSYLYRNKKFELEEHYQSSTNSLYVRISTLKNEEKTSVYKLPSNLKLSNWKYPIYEDMYEWLTNKRVIWTIQDKRD
jgi:dsRNA-specific ribonuclease